MEDKNPWTTLNTKEIYDNPWINVQHQEVLNPNGNPGIYGLVHFKNYAIGIIPIDDEGNIWLVGQYRYPLKQYSWEIPEGGGNLKSTPLESAQRELLEETGLVATHWQEVQRMHLSNSVTDELAIIFVAKNLTQHAPQPEDTEQLTIKKLPFETAYQMVISGEITDSMSVAGILKLKLILINKEL